MDSSKILEYVVQLVVYIYIYIMQYIHECIYFTGMLPDHPSS